jgi:hypothetical protein
MGSAGGGSSAVCSASRSICRPGGGVAGFEYWPSAVLASSPHTAGEAFPSTLRVLPGACHNCASAGCRRGCAGALADAEGGTRPPLAQGSEFLHAKPSAPKLFHLSSLFLELFGELFPCSKLCGKTRANSLSSSIQTPHSFLRADTLPDHLYEAPHGLMAYAGALRGVTKADFRYADLGSAERARTVQRETISGKTAGRGRLSKQRA